LLPDIASRPVLFFDGECNLCNRVVQFIIRHDKKKQFLFASLQSHYGRQLLQDFRGKAPDSVILTYKGTSYIKSAAALQTFKLLGGLWSLLYTGIIVPAFIRDRIYDLIAHNRYKWFGRRDTCMTPAPDLTDRFLTK
jgi:predicted DCC family thiol-disulfide oxidoreductase YuxK